ncbi:hypothetical protein BGZ61DRAFT_15456 [Ilyonectria robusta]|uniref:uncharacterized protein n=1 Tax=Ilyonectria robusta TaxID=1079257 RepID=UPI001E8DF7FD|nr:uncharacterized protein BGZ61DRAFT_15456 [Ilyonectria robusta]KAH8737409.1 hypothetical protein BGZ61DRAFT_15456 [Ilyonectria robusta]
MDAVKRRKGERVRQWLFGKRSKSPKPESAKPARETTTLGERKAKADDTYDTGSIRSGAKVIDSKIGGAITSVASVSSTQHKDDGLEKSVPEDTDAGKLVAKGTNPQDATPKETPSKGIADDGIREYPLPTSEDLWVKAKQMIPEDERRALDDNVELGPTTDVLNELQAVVDEKQQVVQEKTWKINFAGRKIVLRDVVAKICGWITTFNSVGDFAAGLDPVHLALPWAAIKAILSVATADVEQAGQILIGVELVTSLINRCRIYERLYIQVRPDRVPKGDALSELQKAIVLTYRSILSFLATYIKVLDKNTFMRTLGATFDPGKVSVMLADIGRFEERCEITAGNCERTVSSMARQRLDKAQADVQEMLKEQMQQFNTSSQRFWKKLEDDERCKILQWISEIPYETDHYNAVKGRVKGTGQWLLDHEKYSQWRSADSSTTLWLSGIPGAGKTKLSSKVIDDILLLTANEDTNEAFAYFYCDRNRTDHRDPVMVLRSLVRQLSTSRDESTVMTYVEAKYTKRKRSGFSRDQLTSEECEELLLQLTRDYARCTIAIDGLDECDRDTRTVLMDTLDLIVEKSSRPLKIYIASRRDQDLRERYEIRDHLEVTANDNQSDIEKFVLNKLDQSPFCRTKMTDQVRKQILQTFHSKSQGMFQWAALHINELLKLNRNKDILSYLDRLPRGLEAAYKNIYSNIDSQEGSKREVAFLVFKILMCSWRPLSPAEMVIAATQNIEEDFYLDPDVDIDYILDACHNLVVLADGLLERFLDPKKSKREYTDLPNSKYKRKLPQGANIRTESNAICRFSHLSVREYLELHHWSLAEANAFMACICLRTLIRLQWDDVLDENQHSIYEDSEDGAEARSLVEHPWLRVGVAEADHRRNLVWEDSDQESVGYIDHGDDPSFQAPEFCCILELSNVHFHKDASVCSSVTFQNYIKGHEYTDLEKWTQYASETWSLHVRRGIGHESLRQIINELVLDFMGDPESSNNPYRAWSIFNRGNINLTMDNPEHIKARTVFDESYPDHWKMNSILESMLNHTFTRPHLRPTHAAGLGCALLGLDHILDEWIKAGKIDVNQVNASGDSLLHLAIRGNHYKTCETLLSHGANPNAQSSDGYLALQVAIFHRRLDILKLLLKYEADPAAESSIDGGFGNYAIVSAVIFRQVDAIKILVECSDYSQISIALKASADQGDARLTKLLISSLLAARVEGDNTDAAKKIIQDTWSSALTSRVENVHILDMYRELGVDVKADDSIRKAVLASQTENVTWLVRQGVDVDQRGSRSNTPLLELILISFLEEVEVIKMARCLVSLGAGINTVDTRGYTPLHLAIGQDFYDLADYFLELPVDTSIIASDGKSLLVTASTRPDTSKRDELLRKLLKAGLDPNEKLPPDATYPSPLFAATEKQDLAAMAILLKGGARYILESFTEEQRDDLWAGLGELESVLSGTVSGLGGDPEDVQLFESKKQAGFKPRVRRR